MKHDLVVICFGNVRHAGADCNSFSDLGLMKPRISWVMLEVEESGETGNGYALPFEIGTTDEDSGVTGLSRTPEQFKIRSGDGCKADGANVLEAEADISKFFGTGL